MTDLNRRTCLTVLNATLLSAAYVVPTQAGALDAVPQAKAVGKARYTYLGLSLFDATLYAPGGRYDAGQPFALRLDYLKSFKARRIVESSIAEIRKQGFDDAAKLEEWRRQMISIFPDIVSGSHITGVRTSDGHAQFFHDGKAIGTIRDPASASCSSISGWGKTSSKALRTKLLGGT